MTSLEQHAAMQQAGEGQQSAVRHALFWLVLMNAIGVMLSVLLLLPAPASWMGEWTYGRWMMVHMNLGLYGWCCLPMLALLFHVYQVERSIARRWARPVVWLWSASLALGAWNWLQGHSSGKLFLDWSASARIVLPLAMQSLWLLLAVAFVDGVRARRWPHWAPMAGRAAALVALAAVPAALYVASNPALYPHFNPDTGGPTGASQLESSLGIVAILLIMPLAMAARACSHSRWFSVAWLVLLLEGAFCAAMDHADASHHLPAQYVGLGLLLVWVVLLPRYYRGFLWRESTMAWRRAFLLWWIGLVITGWIAFLPGVLDRIKFTDALVGHSLTAIAGCLSAFLILTLQQLPGNQDGLFSNRRSRLIWNHSVLLYVVLMAVAGWVEGGNPGFTMEPGVLRNLLYMLRMLSGVGMLVASLDWLLADLRMAPGAAARKHTTEVPA